MSLTEDGFVVRHSGRADLWPEARPSELPVSAPGAGLEAIASETPEPVAAQPAPGPQDLVAAALAETAAEAQKTFGPEVAALLADPAAAARVPVYPPKPPQAPAGTAAG
jgi:hypothetical protein